MNKNFLGLLTLAGLLSPCKVFAAASGGAAIDLTHNVFGIAALVAFITAYALVIAEEFLKLRKSKPVVVAAGVIWALVGIAYLLHGGDTRYAADQLRHNLEYGELLLFLLVAMTFINTLQERDLFNALRGWLISAGFA